MVSLHRANQGGSVVNFVVIGVILVIAVISVGYVVQKRGEQARKDIAISTVNEQIKDSSGSTTKAPVKETAETNQTKPESEGDAEQDKAAPSKPSDSLPVTGPAQNVTQLLAVGLITMAVTGYILSRRDLMRSL